MAYVEQWITPEYTEKIRADIVASESSEKILRNISFSWYSGRYKHWAIDREKDFYIFQSGGNISIGYASYAFFFRGVLYVVRTYIYPNRIIGTEDQKVERGFSCFEGFSPVPPDDLMEEFQREFVIAFLSIVSDPEIEPPLVFRDPLIVHRMYRQMYEECKSLQRRNNHG